MSEKIIIYRSFIVCDDNPNKLIGVIGDPTFNICDESCDQAYIHPKHPQCIRIIDCKDGTKIDIEGKNPEDSRRIAEALCQLLNQDYYLVSKIIREE